ncbi:transporter [Halomonas sp. GFAJ-1]|nr:transporter [Halomonas sp. GFAJ-1]
MRRALQRLMLVAACGAITGCVQQGGYSNTLASIDEMPMHLGDNSAALPATLQTTESSLAPFQFSTQSSLDVDIDSEHRYTLPELIDIAQRNSPATRAAWLRAREAELAIDVVDSTRLPQLSANVLAGYERVSRPEPGIPELGIGSGRLTATGYQLFPNLAVEWLLFDFGARDAAREVAEQTAIASNVIFDGAHQKVIFDVSEAYFQLMAAKSEVEIDQERLEDAQTLREVAQGRLQEGVAIRAEVAQAQQIEARAQFDLTLANNRVERAHAALIHAMGLPPMTALEVADLSGRTLPREVPRPLDELIETSLAQRPDIQAALARVRASQSGIDLIAAGSRPKVAAVANIGQLHGHVELSDSRFGSIGSMNRPLDEILAGVVFTMPLFDGGRRQAQQAQARIQAEAAEEDLREIRSAAAYQIVEAYNLLHSSLAAYTASGPLVEAGRETYDTSLGLYENGLATLAEVSLAKIALNDARLIQTRAFSDTFAASTALAFATGRLNHRTAPATF